MAVLHKSKNENEFRVELNSAICVCVFDVESGLHDSIQRKRILPKYSTLLVLLQRYAAVRLDIMIISIIFVWGLLSKGNKAAYVTGNACMFFLVRHLNMLSKCSVESSQGRHSNDNPQHM